jgi:rRNA-processing protein FCF1
MRHGRHKQARRTLSFFEREVGLKPPYHVILDGTFIVCIIQTKFEASSRISKLLNNNEVRFHVHASMLSELQKLREQKSKTDVFDQAISWARTNCDALVSSTENTEDGDASSPPADQNQRRMALSDAARDLYDVVVTANGSSNGATGVATTSASTTKYLVATQDEDLLDALRAASVVPLLRIARGSVLLLEQPSVYAKTRSRNEEKAKWTKNDSLMTSKEQQLVELVIRERQKQNMAKRPSNDDPISNQIFQQRKKTKAKGPNPLSCKKRKQTEMEGSSTDTKQNKESGRKRRRRRKTEKESSPDH